MCGFQLDLPPQWATNACEEKVNSFLKKCNLTRSWNSSGSEALDASLSFPSVPKLASCQQGHSWGGKQWSAKSWVEGGEKGNDWYLKILNPGGLRQKPEETQIWLGVQDRMSNYRCSSPSLSVGENHVTAAVMVWVSAGTSQQCYFVF